MTLRDRIRFTAAEGVREAVFAGLGLCVTTEWMFQPELDSGRVRPVLGRLGAADGQSVGGLPDRPARQRQGACFCRFRRGAVRPDPLCAALGESKAHIEARRGFQYKSARARQRRASGPKKDNRTVIMDKIRIRGGKPLTGTIPIVGAKNAALPLMVASLLDRRDADALQHAASGRHHDPGQAPGPARRRSSAWTATRPMAAIPAACCALTARDIASTTAPYDLVRKMRASVLVLGPLVARCGEASVSLPGGCAIGTRPVDLHLKGLTAAGRRDRARRRLHPCPRAQGPEGRAHRLPQGLGRRDREPADGGEPRQGRDRARQRRARAGGHRSCPSAWSRWAPRSRASAPTRCASRASSRLARREPPVVPDRIETGTYAMAAAITGGDVELRRRPARSDRRGRRDPDAARASSRRRLERGFRVARTNGAAASAST